MNIDGLQELIMNRTTSSTKPDTTRYATHLNELFSSLGHVNGPALVDARHSDGRLTPWHDNRRDSQHQSR